MATNWELVIKRGADSEPAKEDPNCDLDEACVNPVDGEDFSERTSQHLTGSDGIL